MSFPASSTRTALDDAAELFRNAKRVVVLTGAGISTPSGIPDFRSEGTGLWSRDEPMEVASLSTFRTHPERFLIGSVHLQGRYSMQSRTSHTPR